MPPMTSHPQPVGGLKSRSSGFFAAFAALLFSFIITALPLRAAVTMKSFDVPGGDAVSTLKQFNEQSGVRIVYFVNEARGVTTNAVKGVMTARDALTLMLVNTNLEAVEDVGSGDFTIRQRKEPKKSALREPGDPDKIVKLTPFEVSAKTYNGYAASETVSGSKVATK